MKKSNHNEKVFFALLRRGLWENQRPVQEFKVQEFWKTDWKVVYQLAAEQSVQGLVLQGIEWFKNHNDDPNLNVNIPQELLLQWIGEVRIIEQRNKAMNQFVADLITKMREADIYTLLVKGQGIAQCYERPLWRSCGDIDLLLNHDNYCKAKQLLTPMATVIESENEVVEHLGLTIDSWIVELHGSLRSGVLRKMDRLIDDAQIDVFNYGNVQCWMNGKTQIFIPSVDNNVIFVFTHVLKHFFHGGIGLRQVCDWCRLLWTFKDSINHRLLAERINKAGLMSEWKSFASFAVQYLGMPIEAMPLHSSKAYWSRNASRIKAIIIKSGNFGHNIDNINAEEQPIGMKKLKSFIRYFKDFKSQFVIFQKDAISAWCWVLKVGTLSLLDEKK